MFCKRERGYFWRELTFENSQPQPPPSQQNKIADTMAWWAKASTAPDPDHLMAGGGAPAPRKSARTVKFEELVGPKLLNQDGNEISTSAALKGKKFVM